VDGVGAGDRVNTCLHDGYILHEVHDDDEFKRLSKGKGVMVGGDGLCCVA
jgi:hypothetical protein